MYGGQACPLCLTERDQCTIRDDDKPVDQCEVGKCALEIEAEQAAKIMSQPSAGYS
jgi:hypothetical protein